MTNLNSDNVFIKNNTLYASFDGDADRIVFYLSKNNKYHLLNGDHLSLLILQYIIKVLTKTNISNKIIIGVIYTGYSNGGFMKTINDLLLQLDLTKISSESVITPTGVKYLINEAKKYDISIYFESNGHGSVIINNHHDIKELIILKELFNSIIGDAIMNLTGMIYIMQSLNILDNLDNLIDIFDKKQSLTLKLNVKDKDIYKTNYNQTILVEPNDTVIKINKIMNSDKYIGCRILVRPSGTEDILRVYLENNSNNSANLLELSNEICFIL
jgi:phosphoacetylglucosamine mutase